MTHKEHALDINKASCELLRALRGQRSQAVFARRLGFRGNPVPAWEGGRRSPSAQDFVLFCRHLSVPIEQAFAAISPPEFIQQPHPDGDIVRAWLAFAKGNRSVRELAEITSYSRFALGRWLNGQAKPPLHTFLHLIEALSARLSDWVAALVDIHQVPELLSLHQRRTAAKTLVFEHPWSEAVLRVLELEGHKSLLFENPKDAALWIAGRLDTHEKIISMALEALANADLIRWMGARFEVTRVLSVDTRATKEKTKALKEHWLEESSRRLRAGKAKDFHSYNLISCSKETLREIRALHRSYFQDIRQRVAASEPCETAALVQMNLIEWNMDAEEQ